MIIGINRHLRQVETRDIIENCTKYCQKWNKKAQEYYCGTYFFWRPIWWTYQKVQKTQHSTFADVPDAIVFGHSHPFIPKQRVQKSPNADIAKGITVKAMPESMAGYWAKQYQRDWLNPCSTQRSKWLVADDKAALRPIYDAENKSDHRKW